MENITDNVIDETNPTSVIEQVEDAPKTYTAEDVAKLIQSETDKRVNQALKTQQKK